MRTSSPAESQRVATATRCPASRRNFAHRASVCRLPLRGPERAGDTIAILMGVDYAAGSNCEPISIIGTWGIARDDRPDGTGAAGKRAARKPGADGAVDRRSGGRAPARAATGDRQSAAVGNRPRGVVPGVVVLARRCIRSAGGLDAVRRGPALRLREGRPRYALEPAAACDREDARLRRRSTGPGRTPPAAGAGQSRAAVLRATCD